MSPDVASISALSHSRKAMSHNLAHGGAVRHPALRPFVTTGVALVGASVIAVSTIAPAPPSPRTAEIPIASPAVQLTAAPSPLEFYPQVVGESLVNAGFLVWDYVTVGPALVAALVTDPVTVLDAGAANIGFLLLLAPAFIFGAAAVIASPVTNGLNAGQVAFDDVGNAVAAGDLVDIINAVVDLPARIIDGALNGGYSDPGGYDGGLLSPAGIPPGPLAIPVNILAAIIGAAGIEFPFRPAPADEAPSLRAATVTLSTGPSLDSGSPPADTGLAEAEPKAHVLDQQGLDFDVAKPGNNVDGLANAIAQASDFADQGVDAAREKADELANATAEPPGPATGGLTKTTTDPPAQQDQELDPTTTERPAGGTDLTEGNKVQPGQSHSTDPTTRKTPLRDAFNKAGIDINKVVTDLSSHVKKALSGGKNDADNGDDAPHVDAR